MESTADQWKRRITGPLQPLNFRHKGPVMRKAFLYHDVFMALGHTDLAGGCRSIGL